MAFTEDHSEFLHDAEFASVAAIGGASVSGIFDHIYVEVMDVNGERPTFLADSGDVSAVSIGDTLAVNSTIYTVRIPQPDGTGMTMLILEETPGGVVSLGDTRLTEAGATRTTEAGDTRITG